MRVSRDYLMGRQKPTQMPNPGGTGDRRNVPQFFDEWKSGNVRPVSQFLLPTFSEVFVPNRSQDVVRFVVVQSVHCVYKQNEN